MPVYLMVYDTLGGPAVLREGRLPAGDREAVVDRSLADRFSLGIGDRFVIADFEFSVAGLANDAAAFFMPFVFISYDGLLEFILKSDIAPDLSAFPLVSHLLVELEPGADPLAVARVIEASVAGVDVYTPAEMAQNDVELGMGLFGPVLGLLVGISYVVGVLVVGLIIYADVRGHRRTYGVLKALGFRLRHLAAGVAAQTLLLLVLAFPLGTLFGWAAASCIEIAAPLYRVPILDPEGLVRTFGAGVAFALAGGMLPLRAIAAIDPIVAFRGD